MNRLFPIVVLVFALLLMACTRTASVTETDVAALETTTTSSLPDPPAATTQPAGTGDPTPESSQPPAATTAAPETTTPDATVSTVPLVTVPADTDVCSELQNVEAVGELQDDSLVEVSGIVSSRQHDGVLWVHNDSGGEPEVYAVATDGSLLSTHRLDGVFPLDWEDIAIGPGPDPALSYLYIGDIGDNLNFRPEIVVYRISEPQPFSDGIATDVEQLILRYPEPGINAESLTVDPVTGDLYVFAKTRSEPATVYRAGAADLASREVADLEPVGVVGIDEGLEITAADFSPSGDRIALRGYESLWVWPRSEADAANVLAAEPCEAGSPREEQGEAASFSASGTVIYTVSEGSGAAVNQVGR